MNSLCCSASCLAKYSSNSGEIGIVGCSVLGLASVEKVRLVIDLGGLRTSDRIIKWTGVVSLALLLQVNNT